MEEGGVHTHAFKRLFVMNGQHREKEKGSKKHKKVC